MSTNRQGKRSLEAVITRPVELNLGTTTVYEGPAVRAGKYVLFFDLVVTDALRKSQL